MKTIYKVNGRTFKSAWEAKTYIDEHHFLEIDREEFEHKGHFTKVGHRRRATKVICINVASKQA
jgi:hypothetical protein